MSNKEIGVTRLIGREEAAESLGVRPQTLASWACNGRYTLPFVKIGRRVMYRLVDIEGFIADNLISGRTV